MAARPIAIQSSDSRLIPDLSASGNIEVETHQNTLAIPQEAVFGDTGKPVVYVKQAGQFVSQSR